MVKLIDRLINKEYLTERERKEWLGHIKEYIEKIRNERDDVVDGLMKEFNELYTKYHELKIEYEKTRYLLDLTIKEAKKNE